MEYILEEIEKDRGAARLQGLFVAKDRRAELYSRCDGMCKILLDGADEWKKMGRRSII